MTSSRLGQETRVELFHEILFMLSVGAFLGLMGGAVGGSIASMIGAAVLVGLFGAYNRVLKDNNGIVSGLVAGSILGVAAAAAGLILGGKIDSPISGALFGLERGVIMGIWIGVITRAEHDEQDGWPTKLFLAVGSVVVGAFLGAAVGLTAGLILGILSDGFQGTLIAAVAGSIVGGYLCSYYRSARLIIFGLLAGATLAGVSHLIGGALAGVILGLISGSFAPMLLMAAIGAFGGLTSRGVIAMFVEAIEAPSEMVTQSAVPFLVPAMTVGMVIGASATSTSGLIALPTCLAIVGLVLGVFGELERKPNNRVTAKTIVEMAIMGADKWPIGRVVNQVRGNHRRNALLGAGIGLIVGVASSAAGALIGQWIIRYVSEL